MSVQTVDGIHNSLLGDIKIKPAEHTHEVSLVNGLQTALNGKANNTHTHSIANISYLPETLEKIEKKFIYIDLENSEDPDPILHINLKNYFGDSAYDCEYVFVVNKCKDDEQSIDVINDHVFVHPEEEKIVSYAENCNLLKLDYGYLYFFRVLCLPIIAEKYIEKLGGKQLLYFVIYDSKTKLQFV